MNWSIFNTAGELIERGDDATLTVYDGKSVKVRDYTAAEKQRVADEAAEDARMDSLEARVAHLESLVMPPAPATLPTDTTTIGLWPGVLGPGQTYREPDGTIVRNATTVPLTTPRSGMPGGGSAWDGQLWKVVKTATVVTPPATTAAWATGIAYKVGDLVTYGGKTYRCLQAHTSRAGWTPTAAVSLWTVA